MDIHRTEYECVNAFTNVGAMLTNRNKVGKEILSLIKTDRTIAAALIKTFEQR